MKRNIIIFLAICALLTVSCKPSEEALQQRISSLKSEVKGLRVEVEQLSSREAELINSIGSLRSEERVLKALSEGKSIKYIIKFRLKQSHLSLDPGVWMKDSMNEVEFEMPVDKEFYESVKKGQKIVDDFRYGSLLIDGRFGSWDFSVIGKRTQVVDK